MQSIVVCCVNQDLCLDSCSVCSDRATVQAKSKLICKISTQLCAEGVLYKTNENMTWLPTNF